MKAVVQRVDRAEVWVDGKMVGKCGTGLLVFVAAHRDDGPIEAAKMADRIWGLRIFNDQTGRINLALKDLPDTEEAQVLAVSNFTVYGDTSKNRRPSFSESAPFDQGLRLFNRMVDVLRELGCRVETGMFGAHMQVHAACNGPVTVIVDVPPQGQACRASETGAMNRRQTDG